MEKKNSKCHLLGRSTSTTSNLHYESFPSPISFYITHCFSILEQSCWRKTLHTAALAATHHGVVSGIQNSLGKGKEGRRPEDRARSKENKGHL